MLLGHKNYLVIGILSLIIICVIAISAISAKHWLQTTVDAAAVEIAPFLSKKLGHTVSIGKFKVGWHGLRLTAELSEVLIKDQVTAIPMFMVDKAIATIDLWETIVKQQVSLAYLQLISPRLVIQRDAQHEYSVLGLVGEQVPGTISIDLLLSMLATDLAIEIKQGDFHLQLYPEIDLPFSQVVLLFSRVAAGHYNLQGTATLLAPQPAHINLSLDFYGKLKKWRQGTANIKLNSTDLAADPLLKLLLPRSKLVSGVNQGKLTRLAVDLTWQQEKIITSGWNFFAENLSLADPAQIVAVAGNVQLAANKPIKLDLQNVIYRDPSKFANDINITKINGELQVVDSQFSAKDITVHLADTEHKIDFTGQYDQVQSTISDLNLQVKTTQLPLRVFYQYLPINAFAGELQEWLTTAGAAQQGSITNSTFTWHNQQFAWQTDFQDLTLQYAPDWPELTELTGSLRLNNTQANLTIDAGKIVGEDISNAHAIITDLNLFAAEPVGVSAAAVPLLQVAGNIDSSLAKGIDFLLVSPLAGLGDDLQTMHQRGKMGLEFTLSKELVADSALKIIGALQIADGELKLTKNLIMSNVAGKFNFTENSFHADEFTFNLLGEPGRGSAAFLPDANSLEVNLDFKIAAEQLQAQWPVARHLQLTGTTGAKVQAKVPRKKGTHREVLINSDLQGMAVNLPAPLGKAKDAVAAFALIFKDNASAQRLTINYAEIMQAKFELQNDQLQRGHVVFGRQAKADWLKADEYYVNGNIDQLAVKPWLEYYKKNIVEQQSDHVDHAGHPEHADQANGAMPASIKFELMVGDLTIFDRSFMNTWLRYDTKQNILTLENNDLYGDVIFANEDKPLQLKFKKLYLDADIFAQSTAKPSIIDQTVLQDLPVTIFSGTDVRLKGVNLGRVEFNLLPKPYGFAIENLSTVSETFTFTGSSSANFGKQPAAHLAGEITSNNIGKLFKEWGLGDSISNGKGNIVFIMSWPGGIEEFAFAKAAGNADIKITNGQLIGINPGLGRIIGLLSLESIQRRIQLDFRDLLGEGFAFDKLSTKVILVDGALQTTEDIIIEGPAARIGLQGKAWFDTRAVDFKMRVDSKATATLPLAAAIAAGNPAVGAVLWLVDKTGVSKLNNKDQADFQYQISGTWDKPDIKEIKTAS